MSVRGCVTEAEVCVQLSEGGSRCIFIILGSHFMPHLDRRFDQASLDSVHLHHENQIILTSTIVIPEPFFVRRSHSVFTKWIHT